MALATGRFGIGAIVLAASLVLPGLVSVALAGEREQQLIAELQRFPLQPVDTSSPRATLASFIDHLNAAAEIVLSGGDYATSRYLADRAARTLQLAGAEVETLHELERARLAEQVQSLIDVVMRIELPPWESVPDASDVESRALDTWEIPKTAIKIIRVREGVRAGEFLFSAETIAKSPEFQRDVAHLPIRPQMQRLGHAMRVFRESSAWPPMRSIIEVLPEPFHGKSLGMARWKWITGFLVIAAMATLLAGVFRWAFRWDQRQERPIGRVGLPLACLVGLGSLELLTLILRQVIHVPPIYRLPLEVLLQALFYFLLVVLVIGLVTRIGEVVIRVQRVQRFGIQANLIRLTCRVIGIAAAFFVAIIGADRLGIPIAPLLAGLGVGGLAIALAVRPTLENVVGGFVLFADRPVRVGDFCLFGDKKGTVEEIGLRSTRLRALDRTVITVPNSQFSELQLVNFTRRDQMLYHVTLGLRYETTPDQLRHVMAKIREMLIRHERVAPEPARVRLLSFGDSAFEIEIFAYVAMSDYAEYLGVREDLNLRIIDIVAESGTGFAFPSQTLYLGRDAGLDTERGKAAMAEVETWRREQRLPFPELDAAERDRIADTLAYPPMGSPHARVTRAGEP